MKRFQIKTKMNIEINIKDCSYKDAHRVLKFVGFFRTFGSCRISCECFGDGNRYKACLDLYCKAPDLPKHHISLTTKQTKSLTDAQSFCAKIMAQYDISYLT